MASALQRLKDLAGQVIPVSSTATATAAGGVAGDPHEEYKHNHHIHQLSPTLWLWRAAQIEPDAPAVYHKTANGQILKRTYLETAERAKGLAYYLRQKGYKRVGILCTNTPAFLEAIFGIGAAGAVNVAINYRLKPEDLTYIFEHSEVDSIIVDAEFEPLLQPFREKHPNIPFIVDTDTDQDSGPYDLAVREGLRHDTETGGRGWAGLETEVAKEDSLIALAYTSGTTSRPKGVEFTHRGAYMAAMANVIESALNAPLAGADRCHYLWTLPVRLKFMVCLAVH